MMCLWTEASSAMGKSCQCVGKQVPLTTLFSSVVPYHKNNKRCLEITAAVAYSLAKDMDIELQYNNTMDKEEFKRLLKPVKILCKAATAHSILSVQGHR